MNKKILILSIFLIVAGVSLTAVCAADHDVNTPDGYKINNDLTVKNQKVQFQGMDAIQTIYVSDSFVTTGSSSIPQLFSGDINLVGGSGTVYSSGHIKLDYAHIDGGTSNPGYFTRK